MTRHISWMSLVVAWLVAGPVAAQEPDRMGIFFAAPFVSANTNLDTPQAVVFSAYLVVLDPTLPALCSYEVGISVSSSSVFLLSCSGPNGWVNYGTNLNHIAGYQTPLLTSPCNTVLATCQLISVTTAPVNLVMDAASPASIPGHPVLWGGDECTVTVPCSLTSGLPTPGVVATLNGSGVTVEPCTEDYAGPVWYVATTGDDAVNDGSYDYPFATLRRAVTAAAPDDTIRVFDGVYTGPDNRDIDLGAKHLDIGSVSGDPTACIVDLGGADGLVYAPGDPTLALAPSFTGLTFRGGATAVTIEGVFWAVSLVTAVRNCRFEDNATGLAVTMGDIVLADCRVWGNSVFGIMLQETCGTMTGCWFEQNAIGLAVYEAGGMHNFAGTGSVFVRNQKGLDVWTSDGGVAMTSCRFDSSTVDGVTANSGEATALTLTDCQIRDNARHGVIAGEWVIAVEMIGGEVTGNGGDGFNCAYEAGGTQLTGVLITDNGGWGVFTRSSSGTASAEIRGCEIRGNALGGIGGGGYPFVVEDCLIVNNDGPGVQVTPQLGWGEILLRLASCTVAGNEGAGLYSEHEHVVIAATIIADNTGAAAVLPGDPARTVTCSDVHGNAVDFAGDLAGLLGVDGNISVDPLFCDQAAADHHLLDFSPCAPGNHPDGADCGLIGAAAVGCFAAPVITAIDDVPHDQGLQVRLRWDASHFDAPDAAVPVIGYGLYRWEGGRNRLASRSADGRVIGWDYLDTIPARGDPGYQYVAPTLCDSTEAGPCWSVFFVSAVTADPFTYFDSPPDSGYSVDDLVPPPPGSFLVAYGPQNHLEWTASAAPDVAWYNIYRGDASALHAGPLLLVFQTQATSWDDPQGTWGDVYELAAVDDGGNTSDRVRPIDATDVPSELPRRTELVGAHPNPFNPATTIVYTLAGPQVVTLRVYDLAGCAVSTLVNGERQPGGRYELVWRGRDDADRPVAAGAYVCRLTTSAGTQARKMTLVR